MDDKYTLEKINKAVAVFEYKNGKRRALMQTFDGGLYLEWLDYKGMFLWGAINDCNDIAMSILIEGIKVNAVKVTKSPHNLYHVWHICLCKDCSKFGGMIKDHSQATFNEHFRNVPVNLIYTFPAA